MPYNLIHDSDCPEVLREFLFYTSTIRNLSPNTINGYYIDLRLFFRFLKWHRGLAKSGKNDLSDISISDIDLDFVKSVTLADIYEYLNFVMRDRDNNPRTRARKLACLRTYFKYMTLKANKLQDDPVKNIDVPSLKKAMPKFLTLDESKMLLAAVKPGDFYTRDYCILTLFLNCGMRLSELCGINLRDVRDETIRIVGKGNKERFVYLNEACNAALDSWLTDRRRFERPSERQALFLSARGTRLTTRRVEQIVDEAIKAAGLEGRGYSPHKLRHTAATLMYQYGGADMLALKEILGHEHVSTTEIYTHINSDRLRDTIAASPLAGLKPDRREEEKTTGGKAAADQDDQAEQPG